jgi:hypothetical protein
MWRQAPSVTVTLLSLAGLLLGCGGGGSAGLPPPPVPIILVSITPQSSIAFPDGTVQFTATVTGTSNTGVSWSVDGVNGGNSTVGTIDANGLYTAPAVPPSPHTVTVRATSLADSGRTASASLEIVNPVPALASVSPATIEAGSSDTALTIEGAQFTRQSLVQLADVQLETTFESSTELRAVIPAAQLEVAGRPPVTVITPEPGGGASDAIELTILIVVGVTPSTPTLAVAQTQQFTATVTGSGDQTVDWAVNDIPGGNATLGLIDASGLYTAPAVPPVPNLVTVKATSTVDPSRSDTAALTIPGYTLDGDRIRVHSGVGRATGKYRPDDHLCEFHAADGHHPK